MPLFAGFATKFILFQAAADQDLLWLAGVAATASFVSLYYYLVIIRQMYIGVAIDTTRFPIAWREYAALAVLVAGVLFIGLYPAPVFEAIDDSTATVFTAFTDGGEQAVSGR
jgi:NADH-quinone oxidoreductase subunit N